MGRWEHLPRQRKGGALPGIISTQEVERLISHADIAPDSGY